MNWHLVVRTGDRDNYSPQFAASSARIFAGLHRQGDPWSIGTDVLRVLHEDYGLVPSSVALDLLHFASAAYTADLRIPRDLTAERWTREIVMHLPVENFATWEAARAEIQELMGFLTGDRWEFLFRRRVPIQLPRAKKNPPQTDAVCLFSGGLDSLVGAIDLLAKGRSVALVGHHGSGIANSVQERVLTTLGKANLTGKLLPFLFYVEPQKGKDRVGEPSQRSRSIMFLALGTIVATCLGDAVPLVVAENGLISLNVPLTNARMGSLSTRTTHPFVMKMYRGVLQKLGIATQVELPYRFKTKGEMLKETLAPAALKQTVAQTMSCSHPEAGRWSKNPNVHCGYCVPCIIRRASLHAAQISSDQYIVDVLTNPPDTGGQKARDLTAFKIAVERFQSTKQHSALFNVLASGPLPDEDVENYAGVYRRGMDEVKNFLKGATMT